MDWNYIPTQKHSSSLWNQLLGGFEGVASPMPHPLPKVSSQNYKHMSSKKLDRYTNNEILGKIMLKIFKHMCLGELGVSCFCLKWENDLRSPF